MNPYIKNVNRIEFVVTMACTGRCIHCSEGDHIGCGEHINEKAAVAAIDDLCANFPIQSLMTFGGEPLLYPETVCKIHDTARQNQIPQRDLITNGFFSKDEKRIKEVAYMLAQSGITKILLSADAFHQETIPLEPVKYFAECIKDQGLSIRLSPAWLVSREDPNPYNIKTIEILQEFEALGIPVSGGNIIFPSGNALKYLSQYFDPNKEYRNPYEDDPTDIRTISFDPDGSTLGGNINRMGIMDIIESYKLS